MKTLKVFLSILAACFTGITHNYGQGFSVNEVRFVNKLLDASSFITNPDYQYAYAPSIIYDETNKFFMCFCSTGVDGNKKDFIRYSTSEDGRVWSAPEILLSPSGTTIDKAACDPSMVYFDGAYYLYYSGYSDDDQTVIKVARSDNVNGPFKVLDTSGNWTISTENPTAKTIIFPIQSVGSQEGPNAHRPYGAGQQTVVNKNGMLYMWYLDDSELYDSVNPNPERTKTIYRATSTDGINWTQWIRTNVKGYWNTPGDAYESVDVKYDPGSNKFVMFHVYGHHDEDSELSYRTSEDGITWTSPIVVVEKESFPDFAHNVGVSGDRLGHIIGNTVLAIYGAPFDLHPSYDENANNCRRHSADDISSAADDCVVPIEGCDCKTPRIPYVFDFFDLYGHVINPAGQTWNDIPWGSDFPSIALSEVDEPQWPTQLNSDHIVTSGHFDFDGKADPVVVNKATGQWWIAESSGGRNYWGWQWVGMDSGHDLALGDYDGDLVTDMAIVKKSTGQWWIRESTHPFTPNYWGWQWVGMDVSHDLALGDYDGDQVTDMAIVKKSTGQWWIRESTHPFTPNYWGWQWVGMDASHDLALGDYDGDQVTDMAIVKKSTGQWWIRESTHPFTPYYWGWQWIGMNADDDLALGDFDGDGLTDKAIVDKNTGVWWIIESNTNGQNIWGWDWFGMDSNHDLVLADYTGDGITDRAIVNRLLNRWYVIPSTPFEIYSSSSGAGRIRKDSNVKNFQNESDENSGDIFDIGVLRIEVYDLNGSKIKTINPQEGQYELLPGLHIYRLIYDKKIATKKIYVFK